MKRLTPRRLAIADRDVAGSQQRPTDLEICLAEFLWPAAFAPAGDGGLQALHGALAVEIEEILGHGTVHLQGKAPVGGSAVELLGQRAEVDLLDPQTVDRAHHLHQRASETVELPHHQHVGRAQVGEHRLELRPLGAGLAALLLVEDLLAPRPLQRVTLQIEVLVLSGHAGVANKHVSIVSYDRYSYNRIPTTLS